MAAPKGNQFWKARSKHGRDKIFSTPAVLWDSCCEYFQWVEDNPLMESKSYMYQGVPFQDQIAKMRAMTKIGLCIFLDIDESTWELYRDREDFIGIITRAEMVIYTQKFAGAAADMLNANIISRELGLSDSSKVDMNHGGEIKFAVSGQPLEAAEEWEQRNQQ